MLTNRLRLVDVWKRHPEILDGEIRQPIFIVGTARSGTSILHEVLAQDPLTPRPSDLGGLLSVPPPEESYARDPRIPRTHREVTLWRIAPVLDDACERGEAHPAGCIFLMAHELA